MGRASWLGNEKFSRRVFRGETQQKQTFAPPPTPAISAFSPVPLKRAEKRLVQAAIAVLSGTLERLRTGA
jgi:hypothetical protein